MKKFIIVKYTKQTGPIEVIGPMDCYDLINRYPQFCSNELLEWIDSVDNCCDDYVPFHFDFSTFQFTVFLETQA